MRRENQQNNQAFDVRFIRLGLYIGLLAGFLKIIHQVKNGNFPTQTTLILCNWLQMPEMTCKAIDALFTVSRPTYQAMAAGLFIDIAIAVDRNRNNHQQPEQQAAPRAENKKTR